MYASVIRVLSKDYLLISLLPPMKLKEILNPVYATVKSKQKIIFFQNRWWHVKKSKSKLIMYFMVNTAFINYFDNLTDSLKFPILLNWTTYKQILPMSLQSFDFDPDLVKSSKTLKTLFTNFNIKKEIFSFKKRHNINDLEMAKKNSFFKIILWMFFCLLLLLFHYWLL